MDTVIDRSENQVVITYKNKIGMDLKATNSDIKKTRETYEKSGLTCK